MALRALHTTPGTLAIAGCGPDLDSLVMHAQHADVEAHGVLRAGQSLDVRFDSAGSRRIVFSQMTDAHHSSGSTQAWQLLVS